MSELHISQAYWQHQARHIPTPYELVVNFYSKWIKFVFHVFYEELLHATMWLELRFFLGINLLFLASESGSLPKYTN